MNSDLLKDNDIEALTNLIVDNPDFDQLLLLLDQFNLFEALGVVREEVRHSKFLSFLLDPTQPHGLGEAFLTKFLQESIRLDKSGASPLSLIELELWDLDGTEVETEWNSIDILLVNRAAKTVVVIENKIDSLEHSDQLRRYRDTAEHAFPGYRLLCLFLSPAGVPPSDDRYIPVSYNNIVQIVERLAESRSSSLGAEVQLAIRHYTSMLRRHIVDNSSVRDLCEQIYRKHKRALDLIYEYRQTHLSQIKSRIADLISETSGIEKIVTFTSGYSFLPSPWLEWAPKGTDTSWSNDGYMLVFWFEISESTGIRLILEIGPGPREIRQALLDAGNENRPLFDPQSKTASKKWNRILRKRLVAAKTLESRDVDKCLDELDESWKKFLDEDLPRMGPILEEAISNAGKASG